MSAKTATTRTKSAKPQGKMSALDAAAKVLSESREPINTKAMIEAMAGKGLWTSPGGATLWAAVYSATTREINEKGADARFVKVERSKIAVKK
jgi:hypothetical protein